MAIEIKTIEADNESEEAMIEIYQSFGWRHKSSQQIVSQNDSEGYTKIVFERNKNMPNYERLVALEAECWAIDESLPDDPPPYSDCCETVEAWAAAAKPSLLKNAVAKQFALVAAILYGVIVLYDLLINRAPFTFNTLTWIIPCIVISVVAVMIRDSILQKKAREDALSNPASPHREVLEARYREVVAVVSVYQSAIERRNAMMEEAKTLVEQDSD